MQNDRSMNNDRVTQLISAYGGNPEHWPVEERETARKLLSGSAELQDQQRTALLLDEYLEVDHQNAAIPAQQADRLADKITAQVKQTITSKPAKTPGLLESLNIFWQPGIALGFSILFVTIIATSLSIQNSTTPQPEQQLARATFDNWMLEQVTGVTSEEETPTELGFMELVELEVDADSSI